jgi:hypothetical protein
MLVAARLLSTVKRLVEHEQSNGINHQAPSEIKFPFKIPAEVQSTVKEWNVKLLRVGEDEQLFDPPLAVARALSAYAEISTAVIGGRTRACVRAI